jgi:hypothetical protein
MSRTEYREFWDLAERNNAVCHNCSLRRLWTALEHCEDCFEDGWYTFEGPEVVKGPL